MLHEAGAMAEHDEYDRRSSTHVEPTIPSRPAFGHDLGRFHLRSATALTAVSPSGRDRFSSTIGNILRGASAFKVESRRQGRPSDFPQGFVELLGPGLEFKAPSFDGFSPFMRRDKWG